MGSANEKLEFQAGGAKQVVAEFDGDTITSDASSYPFQELFLAIYRRLRGMEPLRR